MKPDLRRLFRTTAGRTAVRSTGWFALFTLLCIGLAYLAQVHYIKQDIADEISAELKVLTELHQQRGLPALVQEVTARQARSRGEPRLYGVCDLQGKTLAGALAHWPAALDAQRGGRVNNLWIDDTLMPGLESDENSYWPAGTAVVEDDALLFIAQHVELNEELRQVAGPVFFMTFLGLVTGALLLGVSTGHALLSRVEAINETAREVAGGNLSRRAPRDGSGDEFDELGLHFNEMLEKTEKLVEGMRRVSDNVAHDLRSPLARLRSGLEVTLLEDRSLEQYRDTLEAAIVEIDGMVSTFNSLLQIGRTEAGENRAAWTDVDLAEVVTELAELYEHAIEPGQVTVSGPTVVRGDPHLIRQAVSNLLENAIKFSPAPGTVNVAATRVGGRARITVSDCGPGIPADRRTFVLERFARLEESRSTPGNGLGLTLVKAAADMHRADLVLEDNHPGLRVTLIFR